MDVSYTPPAPSQVDPYRRVGASSDVTATADGRPNGYTGRPVEPQRPDDPAMWQPSTPLPPWQQPGANGGALPGGSPPYTDGPPYTDPSLPPRPSSNGGVTVLGFSGGQWAVIATMAVGMGAAGFYFGRRSKR